ncbi:MAG: 50S ribosomal protein L6 [Flavobacteriales bacterium AspAUS03]
MSRIGKIPIFIPQGVIVKMEDKKVLVKGPLGELFQKIHGNIQVEIQEGQLLVKRVSEQKENRSFHGLYRMLIHNMIMGVTTGFTRELELIGVGYRASNRDQILELSLGFSHNIIMQCPQEVKIETKTEKGKNSLIILKSCDKQLLGIVAAKIRSFRKPEPYKGKGVRYIGEIVRRKAGKSA